MINRVVLIGRLVKDPNLRYTPNGVAVATFVLAVNRTFTNQNGEREADFISCQVWRKQAENAANYLRKGNLAGIEGRIQTRSYDNQEGKRIYVTEVVVDSVQFLEPRNANTGVSTHGNGFGQEQNKNQNTGYYGANNGYSSPYNQFNNAPIDIKEDDLPF